MVIEGELTLGSGHVVGCMDNVLLSCALETCVNILATVTTINLIKKNTVCP